MLDTTNKILATTGALLVVLQTLAFGYWIHVDSKLTARADAVNQRLDSTIADGNARHDATNQRLDATWQKLMEVMERK